VLEGQFGLIINEAPRHHQVAGHPLRAVGLESLDFVLSGAVKFLTCDIVIDLGRTFPIGAVGAPQITGIGYTNRTGLGLVPSPELAGT
jgi:hypothetical protein